MLTPFQQQVIKNALKDNLVVVYENHTIQFAHEGVENNSLVTTRDLWINTNSIDPDSIIIGERLSNMKPS